jgi:hypothetical protein
MGKKRGHQQRNDYDNFSNEQTGATRNGTNRKSTAADEERDRETSVAIPNSPKQRMTNMPQL